MKVCSNTNTEEIHETNFLHSDFVMIGSCLVLVSSCSVHVLVTTHLNGNKSSGSSSIPYKILNLLQLDIAKPLSQLVNLSFSIGKFPAMLKVVKVIPVFKKDSQLECCNYRPISLLSNIDKIIEELMYSRVIKFLDNCNSIYPQQFGFRKNHSTNDALINITENIQSSLDKGHSACGIFVDLQKAFDTVDHNILLRKLEHWLAKISRINHA